MISIVKSYEPVRLSSQEVITRLEEAKKAVATEYGLTFEPGGIAFEGRSGEKADGVKGSLFHAPGTITLEMNLPWKLRLFEGTIRERLDERLSNLLEVKPLPLEQAADWIKAKAGPPPAPAAARAEIPAVEVAAFAPYKTLAFRLGAVGAGVGLIALLWKVTR